MAFGAIADAAILVSTRVRARASVASVSGARRPRRVASVPCVWL